MNRKMSVRVFTITEHEKEQAYLEKMHQKGWKFESVNLLCIYHFTKCEPKDVVYQLDFHRVGELDKGAYIQMFRDCGWEYMQDYFGYSYFRKERSELREDEGIFCDERSRLEMYDRVFKGRMIPLLILFFLVIIPQLIMQYSRGLSEPFYVSMFVTYVCLLVLYIGIFTQFAIQYWKIKNRR